MLWLSRDSLRTLLGPSANNNSRNRCMPPKSAHRRFPPGSHAQGGSGEVRSELVVLSDSFQPDSTATIHKCQPKHRLAVRVVVARYYGIASGRARTTRLVEPLLPKKPALRRVLERNCHGRWARQYGIDKTVNIGRSRPASLKTTRSRSAAHSIAHRPLLRSTRASHGR